MNSKGAPVISRTQWQTFALFKNKGAAKNGDDFLHPILHNPFRSHIHALSMKTSRISAPVHVLSMKTSRITAPVHALSMKISRITAPVHALSMKVSRTAVPPSTMMMSSIFT